MQGKLILDIHEQVGLLHSSQNLHVHKGCIDCPINHREQLVGTIEDSVHPEADAIAVRATCNPVMIVDGTGDMIPARIEVYARHPLIMNIFTRKSEHIEAVVTSCGQRPVDILLSG